MRRLDTAAPDFAARFAALRVASEEVDPGVVADVAGIIARVRTGGDAALLEYTTRFDRWSPSSAAQLEIPQADLERALDSLDRTQRAALEAAAQRIADYHARQRVDSWEYTDAHGSVLGQRVRPIQRVGVYVPGGQAAYPSTVLMNAIPARVAGVHEIIMVSPATGGAHSPVVLAAARIAGVDRVFGIGGAQAVAALAYGTATLPRVDKIVGPGNRYVAAAKRLVYGAVGIDMLAGPSEVVIVADASAPAHWLALDLCAQAEHDPDARAVLLSADAAVLDAVQQALAQVLPTLERCGLIEQALERHGALILTRDVAEAVRLASELAPEHLELALAGAEAWLEHVQHAGAVFLGHHAPEVLGDYCAGPNHVLPTGGSARFSSALGVYDFVTRTSVLRLAPETARQLAPIAVTIATAEGLTAHARAAACRSEDDGT